MIMRKGPEGVGHQGALPEQQVQGCEQHAKPLLAPARFCNPCSLRQLATGEGGVPKAAFKAAFEAAFKLDCRWFRI